MLHAYTQIFNEHVLLKTEFPALFKQTFKNISKSIDQYKNYI